MFYWAGYADKYGGTVQETQLYGTVLTSSLSFISVGTELGTLLICKLIKSLFDIPLGYRTQSGIEVKGALIRGGLKMMVRDSYLYRYLRLSKINLNVPTADIEIKQSGL